MNDITPVLDEQEEEICVCLEIEGDNDNCPVHGKPEGSDTSLKAQLHDAGYGDFGPM